MHYILNTIAFILTAFHSFGNFPPHGPSDPTLSTYKDWGFGPDTVFGIVPLSKTNYRSYVKISRVNNQLYIISKFNPADVLVNTTQVKFNDGGLSLITETNQWGEHYDSAWFIPLAPGKFLCIRRERGVKEEPLCKFEKLVYNKGLLEEKSSLSDTNTLCNNREAVAIYKYKRYEDARRFSLIREVAYFDAKEHAVFSKSTGCSKTVNDYDENGNLVSASSYGLTGEPIANGIGYFMVRHKYDKYDNETEESYYNTEGVLIRNALGWAIGKIDYKNGFPVKQALYDENNHLSPVKGSGSVIAIIKNRFDKSGNQTERSFFNAYDYPAINAMGVSKIIYEYSPTGMLTDAYNYITRPMTFARPEEEAVNDHTGAFHHHFVRDDKGRVIAISQFDKKNIRVPDNTNKVFMTKYRYDDWGRIVLTTFWGDDSTKMNNEKEYHGFTCKYNELGQIAEFNYFDIDANPVHSILGYSRLVTSFTQQGQATERKFFIRDTAITISSKEAYTSNFHSIRYSYDALNQPGSIEYFDEKGQPCDASIKLDNGMAFTAHKVDFNFENGKLLTERFYLAGSEFAVIVIDCQKSNFLPTDGFGLRIRK